MTEIPGALFALLGIGSVLAMGWYALRQGLSPGWLALGWLLAGGIIFFAVLLYIAL